MKFAIVNGDRTEASPSLEGQCVGCGRPAISRCGDVRTWHWAHKGRRMCDQWWENETEWHRAWKNEFPAECQEIRHQSADGEWHIADVKTSENLVIEFQHSPLKPEERRSREAFYQSLVWVVDGTRRLRDLSAFTNDVSRGALISPGEKSLRLAAPESALLRDWRGSTAHVFFDFGSRQPMWWLYRGSTEDCAYVNPLSREALLCMLRKPGVSLLISQAEYYRALIARFEQGSVALPQVRIAMPVSGWVPLPPIRRRFRF